jgi:hypothetical protein
VVRTCVYPEWMLTPGYLRSHSTPAPALETSDGTTWGSRGSTGRTWIRWATSGWHTKLETRRVSPRIRHAAVGTTKTPSLPTARWPRCYAARDSMSTLTGMRTVPNCCSGKCCDGKGKGCAGSVRGSSTSFPAMATGRYGPSSPMRSSSWASWASTCSTATGARAGPDDARCHIGARDPRRPARHGRADLLDRGIGGPAGIC